MALFIHEECFLGVSMMTIKDEMKECESMTCESVIREEREIGGCWVERVNAKCAVP